MFGESAFLHLRQEHVSLTQLADTPLVLVEQSWWRFDHRLQIR